MTSLLPKDWTCLSNTLVIKNDYSNRLCARGKKSLSNNVDLAILVKWDSGTIKKW